MDLSGYTLDTLHQDGDFTLCRGRATAGPGAQAASVLVSILSSEHQRPDQIQMLEREFALAPELDPEWAIRPLALSNYQGRPALFLEDRPCELLERILKAAPAYRGSSTHSEPEPGMRIGLFLRLSVHLAAAIAGMHGRGIVHKNIKPANILVDTATSRVWLTGFGIATRLPRERQAPDPPQTIAGTLAYMAPEQTGRMNRSIDTRSDLYALGITLYEMLTGSPPFSAADPMEWVHCHIARQAVPPSERMKDVPPTVSTITMKLLAKTAEDRYQTAAGLERDLRRCLTQFEAERRIDDFAVGEGDTPDRLLIPEKLYGRERDVETLLAAFERIVRGGPSELVLVSGYAGIGKSSMVNELHRVLAPQRGLFAAGKFDQFKRDIPYATVGQALKALVRSLLASSDRELEQWREDLREALGPNGQLIIELVPELKLVIGEQAPVRELPPQDAQWRFLFVFRRFLAVFARPEHPLALFLDDLQWLDAATLALLEDLLSHPDVRHVLLIGAYRDNEVTSAHQLMRSLDRIRKASANVESIALAPLAQEHVIQLTADALHCNRERAASLAELIQKKTGGNPFFAIQFLATLVDEGLLRFDHAAAQWTWELARIHAKGYTDNVVDLMVDKLSRLPKRTQTLLQQLACLGNSARLELLAAVCKVSRAKLRDDLQQVLRAELLLHSEGSYQFVHDRVREAAYSMIPDARRPAAHLRIGKLLVTHARPDRRDDSVFEIVNQLNRGAPIITSPEELRQFAELNLAAGKRAKASSAYAAALAYLTTGLDLLATCPWERRRELEFELELHSADCEVCTGALRRAEDRLAELANRTVDVVQRCAVARRRVELYAMMGASDRALDVGHECLRHVGIDWPLNPTKEEVRAVYDRLWSKLGGRAIEDLVGLPLMQDAKSLAMLEVLAVLTLPAMLNDENLHALNVSTVVNLSLERGNSHAAPGAYAALALITGARFGRHDEGYRLAKMACHLVESRGLNHFGAKTYFNFAVLLPWTRPFKDAIEPARRAFQLAREQGNPASAAHACRIFIFLLLSLGHPLDQVESQAEEALVSISPFGFFLDRISAPLGLVRSLRGKNTKFGSLDDGRFVESSFEKRLTGDPSFALLECYYWLRKLQARFFAGDFVSAADAANRVERWYATSVALPLFLVEMADCCFFAALARAACCAPLGTDPYAEHQEAIHKHHQELRGWAAACPENFEDRAALVAAEIARLEGRPLDAMDLYERAIEAARASGFVHNEALACELAARFHAARGFATIARAYLRNARSAYLRWGADGKVRQLDLLYPDLSAGAAVAVPKDTINASVEQLDLATVIKVSQAVSREMVLDALIDTLMRTAMEHAGAQRAILILSRGEQQRIASEATSGFDDVLVRLCDEPADGSVIPQTVLHYVWHAQETVIVDDAIKDPLFSIDPYIGERQVRSALCLPLTNQGRKIGVLYLENNLSSRVFAPARTAVLKLLASQAAVSLENSRLYRDVAEREARIRRLVDANIVGIFIWELDGRIVEANDAFLGMVGYDRQDHAVRGLRWTDLTPPEWRRRDEQMVSDLKTSGTLQPFEKEYFRKDGGRIPVLVGVASFDETASQGVAYVVDLSERKHAQEALDRAAAELAHVSKVSTLSALTASIAHEVNQPLSGIMTNASTCLRMLDSTPPNIDGARETARRTIRDSTRASDVIARLRAMFSKRDSTLELLDLNVGAREVIALSLGELQRNQIVLETQLAENLPIVKADRVQLQQVMLNLIRNATDAMAEVADRPRQLLIKTHRDDVDRVCVVVRDTGVGLLPQNIESLFNAFYTTKSDGMGIGLFVSRSIIERHRGRIWAEPNPGAPGATFTFAIPCMSSDSLES
ncbi:MULTISPECIES: trifunctional serine/threonine-protein kinase/ATP-binding protein/sensor histidine kinase [unclassified Variovorax]|uniref:trifunctional serine/threonine-protein kinase/ATP-binding protein/sensor histidine kinase n=1 Tax=unclassified Variovorax TaxID=663243 RepID=UPI00076D8281|nr:MULTISPECIES: trifunctional serine/threonine-protein kinase/ATP-binding protein/sensor histidine kinase [unclassified Variovorax]KWT64524.1 Signal transduction histidine kinase CheA [Variovorax sp. WDL1]PNG56396.1 Sensor histidine kinase TmoS [Variovorax sp. B4]PNG57820.1 Sensor histidine kinase TmoS [Variovorax sp. B2]VTV09739.1 Sensor protein FixL [Variovorax sp. WDL1]